MWDFEKIGSQLHDRHWAKEASVVRILKGVMTVTMEVRAGEVDQIVLDGLVGNALRRRMLSHARNEKSKADKIAERYPPVDFDNVLIGAPMLGAIVLRGEMNASDLIAALDLTADYAAPGKQQLWAEVANIFNCDDVESERVVAEMETAFADRKFVRRGEFFMIVGMRLWLSDIGLVTKDRAKIVEEGKAYVDELAGSDGLETSLDRGGDPFDDMRDNIFEHHVIPEWGSDDMRSITAHYDERAQAQEKKRYPAIVRELLALLPKDPDAFLFDLAPNTRQDGRYWYHPVLASLAASEYAQAAFDASPDIRTRATQTLLSRHTSNPHGRLRPEREWVGQVKLELERLATTARPMTSCRIKSLVDRNLKPLLPDEADDQQ